MMKPALAALSFVLMSTLAHAQDTPPADLREALQRPDWFALPQTDPDQMLARTIRSMFAGDPPPLPDLEAERLLDAPLGQFVGVVFGQTNRQLDPIASQPDAQGKMTYEVGARLETDAGHPLAEALRVTRCHVVSENHLKDGTAMAFQFSEDTGTGYSLSFVIYDYRGPGRYSFDAGTLNYARYVPNALVGMVIATRMIDGVATVVGQFDTVGAGGTLILDELPDGSLLGQFDLVGPGSTDMRESRRGATDRYFSSQLSGLFRTLSMDAPVIVEFAPAPMIGLGGDGAPPPPPSPISTVRVLTRADCP
ncbi:hypothetical protein E4191_09630 [Paracoccus liaowanqingii]|uniref:Uncharacterized protein n=1 Tax=Paracoccus liaowanqingii TaxID=2560053 RepID=A0A4P7HL70_9RHOB|nr:hypothetical protein [Paracoccus liaowanqingii]QBX34944.1 hypothetical protein E4191_09630 [Paracoccus liaowanqingii]